jgi:hypothetical protein
MSSTVRGRAARRTVAPDGRLVTKALTKLLLNHAAVLVDLSRLRLGWAPALQVFPTALAAASWPFARLAQFGGNQQLTAALHGARVPTTVPLAPGRTSHPYAPAIEHESRQVHLGGITAHPTGAWVHPAGPQPADGPATRPSSFGS